MGAWGRMQATDVIVNVNVNNAEQMNAKVTYVT